MNLLLKLVRQICAVALLFSLSNLPTSPAYANEASLNLRLSGGNSFQARNDVQIPNTSEGTRFSLFDEVGEGPVPAVRFELNWSINERHGIRVMLAPLTYTEVATFAESVSFEGENFAAGQAVDATYRFNSWRLGYHYTFRRTANLTLKVGATAKIRDAEIRLEQGPISSANENLGFVPLLYLNASYRLAVNWTLGADFDGLAGGPGRAIDAGLTLDYSLTPRWRIGADLRILDGGADVEEVFNFAQFNSASIAISANF